MAGKEDQITRWFAEQRKLDSQRVMVGIGDDMAQLRILSADSVLITTDMLLDGVHFDLAYCSLDQVGYKSMAASLSDCAAMATVPIGAVCAVGLPVSFGIDQLKQMHRGLLQAADAFDCPLVGGDITKWHSATDRLVVCVSMLSIPSGYHPPVRRSGAKVGDIICVTGTLGGSLADKHLTFTPRVREALAITKIAQVNAMMDISDGLSTDLNRICQQSGVGAVVEVAALPLSETARQSSDPVAAALHDGEDFELLFTVAPQEFKKLAALQDVSITAIGTITADKQMSLRFPDGRQVPLVPQGYDHL